MPRSADDSRNEPTGEAAAAIPTVRAPSGGGAKLVEWVKGACLPIDPKTDDDRADDESSAGGNLDDSKDSAGSDVDLTSTLKPTTRLLPCDGANGRNNGDGAIAECGNDPVDGSGFDDCRDMRVGGCGGSENP